MPTKNKRIMDVGARRWLAKTARKNYWRVEHWMSVDDLISDGVLCWQIICAKYPKVREPAHLMRLFQRTYINHLNKIANKRTAQVPEVAVDELPTDAICHDSGREFSQLITEAPHPLRQVLQLIAADPALLSVQARRYINGRRQTTNEWLCGFVGLDPRRYDLRGQLDELLSTS